MITSELLKNFNDKFCTVFVRLFDKILESEDFPEKWAIGLNLLLFKGGDKSCIDNHRSHY